SRVHGRYGGRAPAAPAGSGRTRGEPLGGRRGYRDGRGAAPVLRGEAARKGRAVPERRLPPPPLRPVAAGLPEPVPDRDPTIHARDTAGQRARGPAAPGL